MTAVAPARNQGGADFEIVLADLRYGHHRRIPMLEQDLKPGVRLLDYRFHEIRVTPFTVGNYGVSDGSSLCNG